MYRQIITPFSSVSCYGTICLKLYCETINNTDDSSGKEVRVSMDKAEFIRKRQEILERQAQFLEERPEIGRLVRMKKIFLRVLMGIIILHFIFSICIMVSMQGFTAFDIGSEVFKLPFMLLWVFLFLNPRGSWTWNLMLYVSAVVNFGLVVQNREVMLGVLTNLSYLAIHSRVLYAAIMFLEVLLPFVLLGFALYLTVPMKHRVMAEVAANMYKETMAELQDAAR